MNSEKKLRNMEIAYLTAIEANPFDAALMHDYAKLLIHTRREAEAITWLERALTHHPSIDGKIALLVCLRACGKVIRGQEIAAELVAQAPSHPLVWLLKGSLDVVTGAHKTAELALRQCISLSPSLSEAWHYLGETLQAQQRWHEAIHAYLHASGEQPTEIFNIAMCYERSGQWMKALSGYLLMHQMDSVRIDVMIRLAQAQAMCCQFDEEIITIAKLHRRLDEDSCAITNDDRPEMFPFSFLPIKQELKSRIMIRYASFITQSAKKYDNPAPIRSPISLPSSPLRIGYISADFCRHALGGIVQGIFSAHARNVVSVHGYSLHHHNDEVTNTIRSGMDHFHNVADMSNGDIVQLIRNDCLDVLIDLGGYTQGSRPEVLAQKPVRIQLGWLGFIHGQQAPWLDGILLDPWIQPMHVTWPYQDKILHLESCVFPGCQQPVGIADRKRFGLPEGVPLLVSFNASYKLDIELAAAWIAILERAPRAWLLVCIPDHARNGFMNYWKRMGGSKNLIFGDYLTPKEQAHRAASCDLFLDAFRYQAGATALSTLATGLPLLTRSGDTPLARSGTSFNSYLGMHQLICADTVEYITKAVTLAKSPQALLEVRKELSRAIKTTDLFNPRRTAADIESICLRLTGTC